MAQKRKIRKKCNQKPSSSEETVQANVSGNSPEGRGETTGVGFVKEVGFKPQVKERGSYRCTKACMRDKSMPTHLYTEAPKLGNCL